MAEESNPTCPEKATRYLKVPLKSTEQIILVFLIPTLVSCSVYIVHFSADSVLAGQHFSDGNALWGSCTIALMYAPALAYFVLTVSRPDWWMSEDDKISKGIITWFLLQLCQMIAFPLFALYRYAGLIVLAVDAILLRGTERRKTLSIAAKPAAMELYFFLQAWFQAAPQAVFQTHLLFRGTTVQNGIYADFFEVGEKGAKSNTVHILSIGMSIAVLSIQTTSFQRFESQRVRGRKLPWAMWLKKYRDQEMKEFEVKKPVQSITESQSAEENATEAQNPEVPLNAEEIIVDSPQAEDRHPELPLLVRQLSATPPLPPRNANNTPPPTPLRGITIVEPLAVPDMPAPPRPDSIRRDPEADENQEEVIRSVNIQEPDERSSLTRRSLRLPKRKYSTKGLEEDDPVGKLIAFLWWFLFIASRIFSIAVFYECYPGSLLGIILTHYVLMLAYLFYYAKDYNVTTLSIYLWLGMVYIFGIIEYKIKFKYADKWLVSYYSFVILQNVLMNIVWYQYADREGYWYTFIFYAIFVGMGLCVMSTVMYHVLFKPKKCRVYTS